MVVGINCQGRFSGPIRPFDPGRDLSGLASLIEVSFGSELAAAGSQMVQDMRQLALWGPAVRVIGPAIPLFTGFVWVENDEIVGNVSISRDGPPGSWGLSNVAVMPEFRGRGIAGRLVDAAIGYVRQRGGRQILLQVRVDNAHALELYLRRGFHTYDTLHEMDLSHRHWVVPLDELHAAVRRPRIGDARGIHDVVVRSTPSEVLLRRPAPTHALRRGLWSRVWRGLFLGLTGQQRLELVVERAGDIVAYTCTAAHLVRRPQELELYVLSEARGTCEQVLVDRLLRIVPPYATGSIRACLSASHPEGVSALNALGFRTLRVLAQMSLAL